ncbi:hypothetical protein DFH09DRAFT_1079755 [Mycena vulgaris]|nr:hypothetical protein DFH09DRAFT_1079755 [Mycena vulgaris]
MPSIINIPGMVEITGRKQLTGWEVVMRIRQLQTLHDFHEPNIQFEPGPGALLTFRLNVTSELGNLMAAGLKCPFHLRLLCLFCRSLYRSACRAWAFHHNFLGLLQVHNAPLVKLSETLRFNMINVIKMIYRQTSARYMVCRSAAIKFPISEVTLRRKVNE